MPVYRRIVLETSNPMLNVRLDVRRRGDWIDLTGFRPIGFEADQNRTENTHVTMTYNYAAL